LDLGIWILFAICFLELGILYIQKLNYNLAIINHVRLFFVWDPTPGWPLLASNP